MSSIPTTLASWSAIANKEFTDSAELFTWLRSNAGGRLRVREGADERYAIIYYKKEVSDLSIPHVAACRSVVWDTVLGVAAALSPGHGTTIPLSPEEPIPSISDADIASSTVTELEDGVMVNMFWDFGSNTWRLATRTCLDATNKFYGKRPFAELFWETFRGVHDLKTETDLITPNYYSWVLRHPEERIVVPCPVNIAKLYLVETNDTGLTKAMRDRLIAPVEELTSIQGLRQWILHTGRVDREKRQGLNLVTADGRRFKMRTPEYMGVRLLRGNQAKLPFLWLERWSEGKLGQYVRFYPEERMDAEAIVNAFKKATQEAFDHYQAIYRRKEYPLKEAPEKYRGLIWEAKETHVGGYFPSFRDFMNRQDIARKLWLVNHDRRFGPVTAAVAVAVAAAATATAAATS